MAEKVVDCKGMICPQPIVETSRAVKAAQSGDIIIVQASDEGFFNDIKAWCEKTGHELLKLEKRVTIYHAEIKVK